MIVSVNDYTKPYVFFDQRFLLLKAFLSSDRSMSSLNLMPSVLSQKRAFIIPLPFNTCITHYSIHSLPLCRTLQCQLLEPCISTKSVHIEFKVLKLYGGRQYKFHGRCYVHYGNYSSRVSIGK